MGRNNPLDAPSLAAGGEGVMGHPLVVHCRREPYDIYIGRPSKWGNPFKVTERRSRAAAVEDYRQYIQGRPELLAALPELTGKKLGCYCAPQQCHGDVLAELANPSRKERHD